MLIETPCFIVKEDILNENLENLKQGASLFKKSILSYSVKTNPLPWLIDYFKEHDLYAEVVSDEEYKYVLSKGYEREKIIFNGPIKSRENFLEAVSTDSIVNIDSMREIKWITEMSTRSKVGLRVNVYNEDLTGLIYPESRFGFSYENGDIKRIIDIFNRTNTSIKGLHFHLNKKDRSVQTYEYISNLAIRIINEFGLDLDYIDFGGGFLGGRGYDFSDYTKVIKEQFEKSQINVDEICMIFEPGAALVATSIDFMMKIVDKKIINHNIYLTADGSRIYTDPTITSKRYKYEINTASDDFISQKQIICGFTCMENDRIMEFNGGKRLEENDTILIKDIGAYTMSLSPIFILGPPRVYLLNKNSEYKLVRKNKELTGFF
ncbi:pyridoxal-dependent decarboxylase [Shimazuella sp. AN120528]|uniref:pyridoxal-dependent decarboxylase n=1 Tax=Shimazuella soli TaxID=1892854 RepID=UPI001F10CBAB|nr:pyridoxal-dependent decarboxylase [Shimazuella soli]MCH5586356.1 pyridoxal-dependent decarboxylase [Shimazuella soli]